MKNIIGKIIGWGLLILLFGSLLFSMVFTSGIIITIITISLSLLLTGLLLFALYLITKK
jgi:hypothetical protein